MPLRVNGECFPRSQCGGSDWDQSEEGFGRIVSGIRVSPDRFESLEVTQVMWALSSLFVQSQVGKSGVELRLMN